jgi:hypothetical protein
VTSANGKRARAKNTQESLPHCSNYLDTQALASYNRRPLSLGIVRGASGYFKGFSINQAKSDDLAFEGIYGDDDPINSNRPQ